MNIFVTEVLFLRMESSGGQANRKQYFLGPSVSVGEKNLLWSSYHSEPKNIPNAGTDHNEFRKRGTSKTIEGFGALVRGGCVETEAFPIDRTDRKT